MDYFLSFEIDVEIIASVIFFFDISGSGVINFFTEMDAFSASASTKESGSVIDEIDISLIHLTLSQSSHDIFFAHITYLDCHLYDVGNHLGGIVGIVYSTKDDNIFYIIWQRLRKVFKYPAWACSYLGDDVGVFQSLRVSYRSRVAYEQSFLGEFF